MKSDAGLHFLESAACSGVLVAVGRLFERHAIAEDPQGDQEALKVADECGQEIRGSDRFLETGYLGEAGGLVPGVVVRAFGGQ